MHTVCLFDNNNQIDVPESLDISSLRKTGIQPGEQPMPESSDTTSTAAPGTAYTVMLHFVHVFYTNLYLYFLYRS
jgi:hypothetical protein